MSTSNAEAPNPNNISLLERIANGRADLVYDFVAAGNSPSARDSSGVSLIQWCAYYGDVSAIKFLLEKGESLSALGDNFDLSGAAFHGHWQLCEFLIERGANPNFAHPDTSETPLHAALCSSSRPGCFLCVRVLLDHGADPNQPTIPGVETGGFMRDSRTRGETPLHRAAAFGNKEVIERLLEAGANRQAKDANGDTPLSWASWHLRHDSILRLLCFEPHTIREGRRSMEEYLLGEPR